MVKFSMIDLVGLLALASIAQAKCHPKYPTSSTGVTPSAPVSSPSESSSPITSSPSETKPSYPVSEEKPKPSYPVSEEKPKPSYPVSEEKPKPSYPVSEEKPKPSTPVSEEKPKPSTPVSEEKPKPSSPVSEEKPKPTTPISEEKPSSPVSEEKPKPETPTISPGSGTFSGITYSPYTAGPCLSASQVEIQLKNVAKYTTNIRLYGADCDQVDNTLNAIVNNGLNLKVILGIWSREGDARTNKETEIVIKALKNPKFRPLITGVTVGNEEVLHGKNGAAICIQVNSVRSKLTSSGISNCPVSTVDVYKFWDADMVQCSDVVYANIYTVFSPKHGDGSIATGVKGLFSELVELKSKLAKSKQIVISETGWPTSGTASIMYSEASVENQCTFLSQFQCQAKKHSMPYYVMEAYDAAWKGGETCEQHFGIFDGSSNLKCKSFVPTNEC